jgi:hypothetical protein
MTIRRALMLMAACSGVPSVAWVQARAQVEQTLLERTRALFELVPSWERTPPRALFLNGARIIVATGTSEQPLKVMLDHFQERCRRESGGLSKAAQQLVRPRRGGLPSLIDGVLRIEEERQGLVACLGLGERELTHEELRERIERFADAGDLSVFGGVRVVRLEALEERTFFVATWSEGALPLATMFPERGDSPGSDPAHIPRPAGSRRLLSAWQEDAPSSIHLYLTNRPSDEAFAAFVQALEQHGFTNQDSSSMAGGTLMQGTLFARGTQSIAVHAQLLGAETVLSVLNMEPRDNQQVGGAF